MTPAATSTSPVTCGRSAVPWTAPLRNAVTSAPATSTAVTSTAGCHRERCEPGRDVRGQEHAGEQCPAPCARAHAHEHVGAARSRDPAEQREHADSHAPHGDGDRRVPGEQRLRDDDLDRPTPRRHEDQRRRRVEAQRRPSARELCLPDDEQCDRCEVGGVQPLAEEGTARSATHTTSVFWRNAASVALARFRPSKKSTNGIAPPMIPTVTSRAPVGAGERHELPRRCAPHISDAECKRAEQHGCDEVLRRGVDGRVLEVLRAVSVDEHRHAADRGGTNASAMPGHAVTSHRRSLPRSVRRAVELEQVGGGGRGRAISTARPVCTRSQSPVLDRLPLEDEHGRARRVVPIRRCRRRARATVVVDGKHARSHRYAHQCTPSISAAMRAVTSVTASSNVLRDRVRRVRSRRLRYRTRRAASGMRSRACPSATALPTPSA